MKSYVGCFSGTVVLGFINIVKRATVSTLMSFEKPFNQQVNSLCSSPSFSLPKIDENKNSIGEMNLKNLCEK